VDDGVTLVILTWETGKVEAAVDPLAVEWIRTIRIFLRLHGRPI
jgi:hypothetical protein